jgi:hypothetical protein
MRTLALAAFVLALGPALTGEVLAPFPPPTKAAEPTAVSIAAGRLSWADGTLRFEGDAEAAALILRRECRLCPREKVQEWEAKTAKEFEGYSTKPEYHGWRLVVCERFVVEKYERGLKFVGKWDEVGDAVV